MNKKVHLIFLVLFIEIFYGCSNAKKSSYKIDYIVYGTMAGECLDKCTTMFKLDDEKLLKDNDDIFFQNEKNLQDANGIRMPGRRFREAQVLLSQLPLILLDSEDKIFGNPGADQKSDIYIQVKLGNKFKTSFIDSDTSLIPIELRKYVTLMIENIHQNVAITTSGASLP